MSGMLKGENHIKSTNHGFCLIKRIQVIIKEKKSEKGSLGRLTVTIELFAFHGRTEICRD